MKSIQLDTFYVFKMLGSDESWGVVLDGTSVGRLPNVRFGIKIEAHNEKEAIHLARQAYERTYRYRCSKSNVRKFASSALIAVMQNALKNNNHSFSDGDVKAITQSVMNVALQLNDSYENHFNEMDSGLIDLDNMQD